MQAYLNIDYCTIESKTPKKTWYKRTACKENLAEIAETGATEKCDELIISADFNSNPN